MTRNEEKRSSEGDDDETDDVEPAIVEECEGDDDEEEQWGSSEWVGKVLEVVTTSRWAKRGSKFARADHWRPC